MHTLLGLTSVALVMLGGLLALGTLRRLDGWSRRRNVQVFVLAAPVVSLALGIGGLHHFTGRTCFLGAPPWDYTLGLALPLGMGLVALGGVGAGLVRLVLMTRVVTRQGWPAGAELQTLANDLAVRLSVPRPRVRLCAYPHPLALTYGVWRPTVLLSTWMVEQLDERELEAVLAHEIGHVARRDYLVTWLALVLRDAFCYLPTSWAVYRQLQREKELACDELAISATHRPLTLASALVKVWQCAIDGPHVAPAQPLASAGSSIEERIARLLNTPAPADHPPRSGWVALCVSGVALVGLLALQATNIAIMLAPMGCGPAGPLWRAWV